VNLFYSVILGIIQGITEFLPISSTAHLTVTGKLLGLIDPNHPAEWTAFIAVIQLGTMAAVLIFFFRDITAMLQSLARDVRTHGGGNGIAGYSHHSRMALIIAVGTIPVVVIGLLFKNIIEGMFTKNTIVISLALIILALVLWYGETIAKRSREIGQVGYRDGFLIGCAQALALIPGSSRSGTTITAALFLGFTREAAARFSFLLSIPAVLASGIYELLKIHPAVFDLGIGNLIMATVVAGISGYAAIYWLLRYLVSHSTMLFVWYRLGLGLLLLLLFFLHVVEL
jgi:undecaprenyl-diphosphatase